MSIKITYVDGTSETFTSPGKYLLVNTEDSDEWISISENKKDSDDDEYDSDEDVLVAEIKSEQVRKIHYAS